MLYAKKVNDFEIEYLEGCKVEKELATLEELEEYLCLYGYIPEGGFIEIKEGYILADSYGTNFFKKTMLRKPMMADVLETFI